MKPKEPFDLDETAARVVAAHDVENQMCLINDVADFGRRCQDEAYEKAAEIARYEEEPRIDNLPEGALKTISQNPVHSVIAAVVATKKSIEKGILSLKSSTVQEKKS